MYISQFRKDLLNYPYVSPIYETEKLLLPIVFDFCKKKNLKLTILPGEEDENNQKVYYRNLLKSRNFFLYKRDLKKSYKRVDNSLCSISIDSSLGYEALSRNNKVGLFNFFSFQDQSFTSKLFLKRAGNYFLGFYNKSKIISILEYLYSADINVWKSQNFCNLNNIPIVKNNFKLNETLKTILRKQKII